MKALPAAPVCLLLLASFPALAEGEQVFDNFLLASPSIIAPSQNYQVRSGRFEAFAGLAVGAFEGKAVDYTTDLKQTFFAAGYAQPLGPGFVLAVDGDHVEQTLDTAGEKEESSESIAHLSASYGVTPLLAIGVSANIRSGDEEAEKYSDTTFTGGITLHQDQWEATLAYATSATSDKVPTADIPTAIAVHGRYQFMPLLTLGLAAEQRDYEALDEKLEDERRYRVILESTWNESSRVELAFESVDGESGETDAKMSRIILGGAYRIASSNMEVGAQANLATLDAVLYKANINRFLVTLTSRN